MISKCPRDVPGSRRTSAPLHRRAALGFLEPVFYGDEFGGEPAGFRDFGGFGAYVEACGYVPRTRRTSLATRTLPSRLRPLQQQYGRFPP